MSELYQLPDGWEWKKLTEVVKIGCDKGFKPTISDGKVPFIGMTDIDEDKGRDSKYVLEDYEKVSKGKTKFQKNAVLVGKITPCTQNNKTTIVPSDIDGGFATTEVYALHTMDNMTPLYLNYFIRSNKINEYLVSTMIGATGRQRVPSDTIKNLDIPLPPLSEQQRIVSKLDLLFEKIDKSIALHQKNMDEANVFMGSVLNDVFGELEEKYGKQSILDGIYIGCRKGFNPTITDGKVPFIGMSNIDENNGINTKYVIEDYNTVSKGKTKFEKNAVLVGKITPCTQNNKTTIVPSDIDGGFATTEVYALHSMDNMNPFYLNHFMRSKEINEYLVSTMVGATGRQRVPSDTIKGLKISIPSLQIQQKVILYLDEISQKIEKIKQAQKAKMNSLKALKASILDQAFKGEL